jgi:hypothetical protein
MRLLPEVERVSNSRIREDAEEWGCKVVSMTGEKQYSLKRKGPCYLQRHRYKFFCFWL